MGFWWNKEAMWINMVTSGQVHRAKRRKAAEEEDGQKPGQDGVERRT
jgi:hypothetical protein